MAKRKNLSNPFSTGGGGVHFEAHVQAQFVALMLTGGHAPGLPCWPIAEIRLQGKIDGFDTDDVIVVVENVNSAERVKLLGQIKHSITVTQGSALFGEVIQAAWNDFNNPDLFTKGKDIIALITGPISAQDAHNVQYLLNQARHTKNVDDFLINVHKAKFSPPKSAGKLEAIQYHLKAANDGQDVSNEDLYDFLNHFHLLSYDLGNEFGVALSLLHSHISQFHQQYPQWVWSRIVDIVQTWNKDAGTITPKKLPVDLLDIFKKRVVSEMPEGFKSVQYKPRTNWDGHPDAIYLALTVLVGGWDENRESDLEVITRMLGISYDDWLKKAREILHSANSPLSLRNGIWKVAQRVELWSLLGSRVFDQNLKTFSSVAVSVLKESDPAFELPAEERYAASVYGKEMKHSSVLRQGIAEGLAILGSQPEFCVNCTQGKAETTCVLVIRELLTNVDWELWGSMNGLLPPLAEAAPTEFLDAVEKALQMTPCPFDELFSQEGSGITGGNYLTGLLWALEGLAWDEQYLVRVSVVLAELTSHDLGGQWANRPSNSLVTILLPWMPQTLASVEKRKVAVKTVLQEWPDIAWDIIVQLLHGQHQTSFQTHKPNWRRVIPEDWEKGVTNQEYWQQASFYAELAVANAGENIARLVKLIDNFSSLATPAFDQLLETLSSPPISDIPEEKRLSIWTHLNNFIKKNRRFPNANWALSEELIARMEHVAKQLAPINPFNLYKPLFTHDDFDFYNENDDWEEQRKKIEQRRVTAIAEIYQLEGNEGVIRFAESVSVPNQVGYALGFIADDVFEGLLLPNFMESTDNKRMAMVEAFIWRRHNLKGWEWCDTLDKSDWSSEQIGQFLAYLPFNKETWARVSQYLSGSERDYWVRANANAYQADGDLSIAIDKLIEHDRPHAAINCLYRMHQAKLPIDIHQCVRALLAVLSTSEHSDRMDGYHIVELIKYLQASPAMNPDDLVKVEWAYVPLLDGEKGAVPQLLEIKLASDPEFFCEMIQLTYRSSKPDLQQRESTKESEAIAENAWRLLHRWKTAPGTQQDGTFSENCFTSWLQKVKESCAESGYLDIALTTIGEVLVNTPPDPNGLWIQRVVAAALNDRDNDHMRDGYRRGTYNSRGVWWVDPTGNQERQLANHFRTKAEDVENSGFQRFAVTLRELADGYDREAERAIARHIDRLI